MWTIYGKRTGRMTEYYSQPRRQDTFKAGDIVYINRALRLAERHPHYGYVFTDVTEDWKSTMDALVDAADEAQSRLGANS